MESYPSYWKINSKNDVSPPARSEIPHNMKKRIRNGKEKIKIPISAAKIVAIIEPPTNKEVTVLEG